jgi:hypothetical protein
MQSVILWFPTEEFVDSDEDRADRINENIGGAALAKWLSGEMRGADTAVTEPWAEDHGWDFELKLGSTTYMIVCTIEDLDPREACVQVHLVKPRRSATGLLDRADAVVGKIADLIEARGASIHFDTRY